MARNVGVNFAGQRIIHPGSYSAINASGMNKGNTVPARRLVFIGSAESGQPGKITYFTNMVDCLSYFRSGDLARAGELAWAPSGDLRGASEIGFLRVDPATQAINAQGSLTATSKGYGATWNRIQHKLENGTSAGSSKYTMFFYPDNYTETYDNIGNIFTLQYTGSDASAIMNVTVDGTGKATKLEIKTGVAAAEIVRLTYDLTTTQYPTINMVVADINSQPNYTASMITLGNHNINSIGLDSVANQNIKTSAYTVKAMKADFLYQTQFSKLASFVFSNAAYPANFSFTAFTAGSDGTVPTDWAPQFAYLYGEGADLVVPLSSNASVHASAQQFVETQSANERNECLGIYGGALSETVDQTIQRAAQLNSSRAILCYPGITRTNYDGSTTTYAPYMTAAMIAGRLAGIEVGEAITLNSFNLIGVEFVLKTADINRLVESGIVAVEYFKNRGSSGYRSVLGITTYQADNNPVYRDVSVRMIADDLSKELRSRLESRYVGKRGNQPQLALIKNDVQSFLDDKVRDGWIVRYDPASVFITLNSGVVTVSYSAQPTEAINYILITANLFSQPITA